MSARGSLRDIRFESVDAKILSIEYGSRVLISWKLVSTTQSLRNVVFSVYRGESPSDLQKISDLPIPASAVSEFIDTSAKLKIAEKNYYYQVIAEEMLGGIAVNRFESPLVDLQVGSQDLVAQYIIDEHNFAFEHVHGIPVFIYKKKTEGSRCTDCWDKVLKRCTNSSCLTCFGTGFVGGYYPPIAAWADIGPTNNDGTIMEFGIRENNNARWTFTNYPLLQLGDIILDLGSFFYWRVNSVNFSFKNNCITLQFPVVAGVNRSDIEQQLPKDEELRKKMLDQLAERMALPEF